MANGDGFGDSPAQGDVLLPGIKADKSSLRKRPPPMQAEKDSFAQDEAVSVRMELLQRLATNMGELGVNRSRMEQQNKILGNHLDAFMQGLNRMQKQLRTLALEAEINTSRTQLEDSRAVPHTGAHRADVSAVRDRVQAVSESVGDLSGSGSELRDLSRDLATLLQQQAGIINALHDDVLSTHSHVKRATVDVLLVKVINELYAIPLDSIDWVMQAATGELRESSGGTAPDVHFAGQEYPLRYLGAMLGVAEPALTDSRAGCSVLLVNAGTERAAIQVDQLLGNLLVAVQSLGVARGKLRWLTGGTILADGDIALLLDLKKLLHNIGSTDSVHE